MQPRWALAVCAAVFHLACAHTPSSAPAPPSTSSVQPVKLRYHGEHRGDHPSWIYTAHVSVDATSHGGRPAWRRSHRFEQLSPPPDATATYEGAIVLDRDTLAPREAQSIFGTSRHHAIFWPDRVDTTDTANDGKVDHATVPLHGRIVTDVWAGLDLDIVALPLEVGFETRVAVYDDKPPRPFRILVERIEQVRVPAGAFDAFRILVEPLDGDDRMRSIYHVRTGAPRVVVRKEYVVNPRTEGPLKQSTGIEELEAIEPPPPAR